VPTTIASRTSSSATATAPIAVPYPGSPAARLPANNATLTGTGMKQRGVGTATVGGPAPNVASINGTTIHSKR
jgi:hypothetical protein